jgi:hypothetical protein
MALWQWIVFGVATATILFFGLAPEQPVGPIVGRAAVDRATARVLDTKQVQVSAIGTLADSCTKIDQVSQARQGNTYAVTITTLRTPGQGCAQAIVPFNQVVLLDGKDLAPGTYTVIVNEKVQTTFSMVAPAAVAPPVVPTPVPTPPQTSSPEVVPIPAPTPEEAGSSGGS